MLLGETLYEPGGQLSHVYFPTTAIVSLLSIMESGLSAEIAGVGNEGITEAAGKLQRAGIISYRRGHISVLKRSGLEAGACECYAVVKKELGRLLSDVQYRQSPAAIAR